MILAALNIILNALSIEEYNRLNPESVEFLEKELKSGQENRNVVLPHIPVFDVSLDG